MRKIGTSCRAYFCVSDLDWNQIRHRRDTIGCQKQQTNKTTKVDKPVEGRGMGWTTIPLLSKSQNRSWHMGLIMEFWKWVVNKDSTQERDTYTKFWGTTPCTRNLHIRTHTQKEKLIEEKSHITIGQSMSLELSLHWQEPLNIP